MIEQKALLFGSDCTGGEGSFIIRMMNCFWGFGSVPIILHGEFSID
jgi:hypothetical protein